MSIKLHSTTSEDANLPAFKCILIGEPEAGKTSFFWRFKTGQFRRRSQHQREAYSNRNPAGNQDEGIDTFDKIITHGNFKGKVCFSLLFLSFS